MNKYLLIVFSLVFVVVSTQAQSKKAYKTAAEKSYAAGDYSAAYEYYKKLMDHTSDSTDIEVIYRIAQSARMMDAYTESERYYSKVLEHPEATNKSEAKFYVAVAKKHNMSYAQAMEIFSEVELESTDPVLQERASEEAKNAEWGLEQMINGKAISLTHHGSEINSVFSDFSPVQYGDVLYYTSVIGPDSSTHIDDFEPVTRILKLDESSSTKVSLDLNPKDKKMHAANYVENSDGSRKYINYCKQKGPNDFHCKLYYSEEGIPGGAIPLPSYINNDTFTATEPTVGIDESGNEVLYFVSDRPGGVGGLDIWYSVRNNDDGTYSQPENLKAINTEGDDITPFFHIASRALFFSTDGRQSMGNFDVYKTEWRADYWSEPEHLGFPINGGYDDTHFSFNSDMAVGHLASNRPGCMCSSPDKICKCNDIYSYDIKVDINTLVFNKYNQAELTGVTVKLVDVATGEIIEVTENLAAHDFNFPLGLEKAYRLVASKNGWAADSIEFNTRGIFFPVTLEEKLYLDPAIRLEVLVFDAITQEPLKNSTVNFSQANGSGLIVKTNETGNDFYYDLAFAENYTITASAEGYSEGSETASTVDMSTPTVIKKSIYLTPFAEKLSLYFDNDYPKYPRRPQINTDTTLRFYGETFDAYYAKKDLFIREYSKGRPVDQVEVLNASMNDFFETEVKGNYEKLNEYCRLLEFYLRANPNKRLEVLMEGFASPLAASEYNKHLTNRRIVCVISHFKTYGEGVLKPYIEGATPRLIFSRISNGEALSPPVEDSRTNPRESIFSRKASIERRVQISGIREYKPGLSQMINNTEVLLGASK